MVDTWRLDIHDFNNASPQASDVKFEGASIGWALNGPGTTEIEFPLDGLNAPSNSLLQPGKKELKWYRNNNLVWGGYLWGVDVDLVGYTLRAFGEGYFSRLRHRVVVLDVGFTDENAHQIAWELIDQTQSQTNGDLNFTQGSHVGGSLPVDREYCANQFPNIGDSISDLASMEDTWDFYISPQMSVHTDKVFRTFNPRLGSDLSGSVEINPDNTHTLTYQIDAHWLANVIEIVGGDTCLPPAIEETHAGSQANYGLMYYVEDASQFDHYRDLVSYARERRRLHQKPRWTATATYDESHGLPFNTYDVGDIVSLTADRGYATFSQDMRCIAFNVDLSIGGTGNAGVKFYTATLDSLVETE
jgi:hypothetical protein